MTTHEKRYFSIDFEKYGHQTDHKSLYVDVPLNEVTVKIELLDPIDAHLLGAGKAFSEMGVQGPVLGVDDLLEHGEGHGTAHL